MNFENEKTCGTEYRAWLCIPYIVLCGTTASSTEAFLSFLNSALNESKHSHAKNIMDLLHCNAMQHCCSTI